MGHEALLFQALAVLESRNACLNKWLLWYFIVIPIYKEKSFNYIHIQPVKAWTWGYKTIFMLNWVEHEILNAQKYKNIKKFSFFRLR